MPELLLRPDLGRKPYRLRCRFVIGANPRRDLLEKLARQTADRFVTDMHKQGWEVVPKFGWRLRGPYPKTETTTIRRPVRIPAKQMLHAVAQGARFLPEDDSPAKLVVPIHESEAWEYELSAVFTRETIVAEKLEA